MGSNPSTRSQKSVNRVSAPEALGAVMSPPELLAVCCRAGIVVARHGDELHVTGPPEAMTPDLHEALAAAKPALVAYLRPRHVYQTWLSEPAPVFDPARAFATDAEFAAWRAARCADNDLPLTVEHDRTATTHDETPRRSPFLTR
jgi:TubC N-terminal docking domain